MFKETIIRLMLALTVIVSASAIVRAQEYAGTPVTISKEKVKVNGEVCYSHIVLEKQTLFSIAKAYEVSMDDIHRVNPTLKETGLKKNSIILIPAAEKDTSGDIAVKAKSEKKQKIHIRKWYEDLDVIADRYGVTVEAIMKANNLTGRKLANRQKLIIPETGDAVEIPETDDGPMTVPSDTLSAAPVQELAEAADTVEVTDDKSSVFTPKDEVMLTLILPMKASQENFSRNNMDFYSGVLLAVRDMAETGISTVLNVYDSTDPSHPFSSEVLKESDVIIGPVTSGDIRRLLASEPDAGTIVSPLDPKAEMLAQEHANFIQAPTPHKIQYNDLAAWIKEDMHQGDKVFMISEKGADMNETTRQMLEAADSVQLDFIPFSYSILEGRDVTAPLAEMMSKDGVNRVIINSDSEAFVNDVVRNLNILLHRKLDIVLYAPSKIRSYETIEVENLHNASLHVSLAYYIDYNAPEIKDFLLKYRALFGTEPTQFSFQGYDTARYFISLCSKYGNRWKEKLEESGQDMLQSTFQYRKADGSGYINNGVRRIAYGKDWTVTKIR